MRRGLLGCLLILPFTLVIVACAAGAAYEITRSEDLDIPNTNATQVEVDTAVSEREELREIAREIKESEDYSDYDTLDIVFTDSEDGFADRGTAVAVMSRSGKELSGIDSESLQRLEEDGDGIFFTDEYSEMVASEGVPGEHAGEDFEDALVADDEEPPSESDPAATEEQPDAPTDATIGESIEFAGFDLRGLDVFETDRYVYVEDVFGEDFVEMQDSGASAGKFVVVSYSVTNTGSGPVEAGFSGILDSADAEFYEEAEDANHPPTLFGMSLPPRGVGVGQLVFDVPQDVGPAVINVALTDDVYEPTGEGARIDLNEGNLRDATPQEMMALYYEYGNMQAWGKTYEMFDSASQEQVAYDSYEDFWTSLQTSAITEYSFPSVDVQGDSATIEVVRTGASEEGPEQQQLTQEMILEDDGWRLVMRDDQIETFTGG
ncbi:MAG: hypothetical protein H0U65_03225 [Rubrobacter sp.]|nr:hypothetical protein [Rubrobacter sp.]